MPGVIGGLYFLIFISGILLVTVWCMKSDQGPDSQANDGLFAMKKPSTKKPPASGQRPQNLLRERV